jgi:hypothetical protein
LIQQKSRAEARPSRFGFFVGIAFFVRTLGLEIGPRVRHPRIILP